MKPILMSRIQTVNMIMLVVTAVSLALGVALIANYLTAVLGTKIYLLLTGGALVVTSVYFLGRIVNPKVKQKLRLRGGFFFEPSSLDGKEIIGYEFNDDMATYLRAIGKENKAYASALLKEKGSDLDKNYNPDCLDFFNLSASCAEFIFINNLSLHLNSYFVHEEIDQRRIKVFPRSEMSSNVLRNRVWDLITRNHQEREAFYNDHEDDEGGGVLCYAVGDSGEIFNNISLELPSGTSLERLQNNSLKIESDVFELIFSVQCNGVSTYVSGELIVGEYDAPWLVSIKIEVLIKKQFFLNSDDIQLYQWLDSFLVEFENYISIAKLHERSFLNLKKLLKV